MVQTSTPHMILHTDHHAQWLADVHTQPTKFRVPQHSHHLRAGGLTAPKGPGVGSTPGDPRPLHRGQRHAEAQGAFYSTPRQAPPRKVGADWRERETCMGREAPSTFSKVRKVTRLWWGKGQKEGGCCSCPVQARGRQPNPRKGQWAGGGGGGGREVWGRWARLADDSIQVGVGLAEARGRVWLSHLLDGEVQGQDGSAQAAHGPLGGSWQVRAGMPTEPRGQARLMRVLTDQHQGGNRSCGWEGEGEGPGPEDEEHWVSWERRERLQESWQGGERSWRPGVGLQSPGRGQAGVVVGGGPEQGQQELQGWTCPWASEDVLPGGKGVYQIGGGWKWVGSEDGSEQTGTPLQSQPEQRRGEGGVPGGRGR